MTDNHPITPPPELIKEWVDNWYSAKVKHDELVAFVATQAARWGSDQELEACCEYVYNSEYCQPHAVLHLRAARRPPTIPETIVAALAHRLEHHWNP